MTSDEAPRTVVCLQCERSVSVKPTVTPLGFESFQCPSCSAQVTYPLAPRPRKSYQIATPVVALMTLIGLWIGKPVVPGVGFVLMFYVLLRDRAITRAVKAVQRGGA